MSELDLGDLSEFIEYIGEVERLEPWDEDKHPKLFKSANNDPEPVTKTQAGQTVEKRKKTKKQIENEIDKLASELAEKRDISKSMATEKVLEMDEVKDLYIAYRNASVPQQKYKN